MAGDRKIVGIWPTGNEPLSGLVTSTLRASSSKVAVPTAPSDGSSTYQSGAAESPPGGGGAMDAASQNSDFSSLDAGGDSADWLGDAESSPSDSGYPWLAIGLWLAGLAWTGFALFVATQGFSTIPQLENVPQLVGSIVAPICGLLLVAIILTRGSERSIKRHLKLLWALRTEQEAMIGRVLAMDNAWREAHDILARRTDEFTLSAAEARRLIDESSAQIESRMREAVLSAGLVAEQGEAARRHMDGLVLALPKVDEVARRSADNLRQAGQSAYQFGGQLEAQIAAITTEAAEAERTITAADTLLAQRIEAIVAATGAAEHGAANAANRFQHILNNQRDNALAMLADLAAGMDNAASVTEQRIEAARMTLEGATQAQLAAIEASVAGTEQRATALAGIIDAAIERSGSLDGLLIQLVSETEMRVAAMEQQTQGRLSELAITIADLGQHFDRLGEGADSSGVHAAALAQTTAQIVAHLSEVTREVDVQLPAAVERLQAHVAESRAALAALPPVVEANAVGTEVTLARLREADVILMQQVDQLAAIDRIASDSLSAQSIAFSELRSAIDALAFRMDGVTSEVAPSMLTSLADVEQAARAAAERARSAISEVAESSAANLRQVIGDSFEKAAGASVAERIDAIAQAAERAVSSASLASDRLMRQLITIADSSAALEARATVVATNVDHALRDTLSRQLALITESLQSTSVDITRILSTEVADQAWESYLKGDRGIFSRRAVTLLQSGDAKQVLRRYQEHDDFRAQVNRYIHDFESMLRAVMDTRDGSSLSVTLLSSDIGKVYVALAQSIERLRN